MPDNSNLDISSLLSGMFLDGIEDLLFGDDNDEQAQSARFIFQAGRQVGRADVVMKLMSVVDYFKSQSADLERQAKEYMRRKGFDDSEEDKH